MHVRFKLYLFLVSFFGCNLQDDYDYDRESKIEDLNVISVSKSQGSSEDIKELISKEDEYLQSVKNTKCDERPKHPGENRVSNRKEHLENEYKIKNRHFVDRHPSLQNELNHMQPVGLNDNPKSRYQEFNNNNLSTQLNKPWYQRNAIIYTIYELLMVVFLFGFLYNCCFGRYKNDKSILHWYNINKELLSQNFDKECYYTQKDKNNLPNEDYPIL